VVDPAADPDSAANGGAAATPCTDRGRDADTDANEDTDMDTSGPLCYCNRNAIPHWHDFGNAFLNTHPLYPRADASRDASPMADHRPAQDHGDGVVRQRRAGLPLGRLAGVVELRPDDARPGRDANAMKGKP
jgi:hypothetical protein